MAALTALYCSTLLVVDLFVFVFAEQKNITAECGQDVTLPCRAPNNDNILSVEWNRADLGTEYVLLYRDDQLDPENQHPSFKDRVELQDRQMKDGDVSLVLNNVTTTDNGTYECCVFQIGTSHRRRANMEANLDGNPISIITLRVVAPPPPGPGGGTSEDGGKEDGGREDAPVKLIIGLSFAALVLVLAAVVGFLIYRKRKQSQDPYHPPVEVQPVSNGLEQKKDDDAGLEKPSSLTHTSRRTSD